jgi:DNA polymerase-4
MSEITEGIPARHILHLDLDSFYVSVERLHNKNLIGKPVIVGGTGTRGVVAACSYEARAYGLHSAMPIMTARRLCPNGIYISGDMEQYSKFSGEVTQIIADNSPVFEKTSIDEFYVDVTGMDRFFGMEKWAWELRDRIRAQTGLPISTGLSINKTVAKIATGEAKPDGRKYIRDTEVRDFLAPLPVGKIPGAGEATQKFLRDMGIKTIGQLMEIPMEALEKVMGKNGVALWKKANGLDESLIVPYSEAKSLSTENTFHTDTTDVRFLRTTLIGMTEQLGYRMRSNNQMAACVSVKIRYSDFNTVTQQISIAYTSRDDILVEAVLKLFEKCYSQRLLIRLIGVRFSKLIHANYQLTLFDKNEKLVNLMMAMDKIRDRYGPGAVGRTQSMDLAKDLEEQGKDKSEQHKAKQPRLTSFMTAKNKGKIS